jgi:hypothetical protein
MINNIRYTNIRVILDDLLQHELLQDLTLEQVVGYVIKFNGILNIPQLYEDKDIYIDIKDYRGQLPCDLIAVKQVRDCRDNMALRNISGTFHNPHSFERAFKTQGSIIFTTFKDGKIEVAYRAIPVDEEGYPVIIDNEKYKNALELFIKKDRFTKYFDTGKISQAVLQNTQQDYCWAVAQASNELKMPSISEWENISNAHNQLLFKGSEFRKGFETTGLPEHYRKH